MKLKKRLKRDLKILRKRKEDFWYEMDLEYEDIKERLIDSYKFEKEFRAAVKQAKRRNRFRKAVAKKLGVKYSKLKKHFPENLNSTLIANYLDSRLKDWSHQEIRGVCQELKLEFGDDL